MKCIDDLGSNSVVQQRIYKVTMGICEYGSQIDQVGIARNVTVEISDRCWRNAGFNGTPAAKDPTCFTYEIGCSVGIVAIEPDVPVGSLAYGGRAPQIALVIEGSGERSDPSLMAVANGAIVGVPAIHRVQNPPARHAESARRSGMDTLAGGVAVRLACSDEACPQLIYRVPARRGEPVYTGCAQASSVAEIPAQSGRGEMVGMRESVQVGLHGFSLERCDRSR